LPSVLFFVANPPPFAMLSGRCACRVLVSQHVVHQALTSVVMLRNEWAIWRQELADAANTAGPSSCRSSIRRWHRTKARHSTQEQGSSRQRTNGEPAGNTDLQTRHLPRPVRQSPSWILPASQQSNSVEICACLISPQSARAGTQSTSLLRNP